MKAGLTAGIHRNRQVLAELTRRLLLGRPRTGDAARRLDSLSARFQGASQRCLAIQQADLARLEASLVHLNPHAVLARGYSIVTDSKGSIVRDTRSLEPNDLIAVCLHSGRLEARVENLSHETEPPRD